MLLSSWKQSLSLLSPKNLKLFILVTIKGVFDICKSRWFWMRLFLSLMVISGSSAPSIEASMSCCLFFLFLIARPSVRLKEINYVGSYFFRYSSLVILASVVLLVAAKRYNTSLLWHMVYLVGPLAPLTVFTILFLLDSKNSIKNVFTSVYRSVKLVFYNAPLIVLFYGLWIVILVPLFGYIIDFVMNLSDKGIGDLPLKKDFLFLIGNRLLFLGAGYVFVLLIIFPVVLFTNYYVKRVHDNFSLYE